MKVFNWVLGLFVSVAVLSFVLPFNLLGVLVGLAVRGFQGGRETADNVLNLMRRL